MGIDSSAPSAILKKAIDAAVQTETDYARKMLTALAEQAMQGTVTWDKSVTKTISAAMDKIDKAISKQLAAVMQNAAFQELDGLETQDFESARVVDQVPALKKLLEARNRLRDLLTRVDHSEELEIVLEQALTDDSQMDELSSSLGVNR